MPPGRHRASEEGWGVTVCFLAGDSYPADDYVEAELRRRLGDHLPAWIGQSELLAESPAGPGMADVAARVDGLRKRLEPLAPGDVTLFGRSSGARVATAYAARHGATAVVCLGFPFRRPKCVIEPERFHHLATLTVPTLIIQGTEDRYGGAEITEHYAFSAAVRVYFVPAGHEFRMQAAGWDSIALAIQAFLAGLPPGRGFQPHGFDEAYYLAQHPDVAAAVAARRMPSGERHHALRGRDQRRSMRWLTKPHHP